MRIRYTKLVEGSEPGFHELVGNDDGVWHGKDSSLLSPRRATVEILQPIDLTKF